MTSIYNARVINLDIHRLYRNDIAAIRVFDVLAGKGFLLAGCFFAVRDLFDPSGELVVYRSKRELLRLVEYYVKHDQERAQIAESGYLRVLRDHPIVQRVGWILGEHG